MRTTTTGKPGLYRLLAWLSPSFPTGAFSYSHGLEAAHHAGAVRDRDTLQRWIAAIIGHGGGRIDADILRDAWHAAASGDLAALGDANGRGLAFRGSAELALESAQQGMAFIAACRAAWPDPFIEQWAVGLEDRHPPLAGASGPPSPAVRETISQGAAGESARTQSMRAGEALDSQVCLPVAFGAAAARAGIALEDALLGYLQAFAGNMVSAGLRLGIVGQTDGQRILAALEPLALRAAEEALARDPEDFGAATFAVDLASIEHETQYTRLFRS